MLIRSFLNLLLYGLLALVALALFLLAMMLVALVLLRMFGRWKAVPAVLLVVAAGIALDALGYCQRWGIPGVGTLAISVTHPALPALEWADWLRVGQLAVALALIIYAGSY